MINDQSQTPTGGQTKRTKTRAKQKGGKSKIKNNDKGYNKKNNIYEGN